MKIKKKIVKIHPITIYLKESRYRELKKIAKFQRKKVSRHIADILEGPE